MLQLLMPTNSVTPDNLWCYLLDSFDRYQHNLSIRATDWFWRDYPLTYTINSQGYRCPEFDLIDWSSSCVFFGCSHTFGEGISDEHTVASLVPGGVNLARCGVDNTFQWLNTIRLRASGIRPRACVYLWTSTDRVVQFQGRDQVKQWGAWNVKTPTDWADPWLRDPVHKLEITRNARLCVDLLWQDICPVVHMSYWPDNQIVLRDCELVSSVDQARDLIHPGVASNQRLAARVRERLNI